MHNVVAPVEVLWRKNLTPPRVGPDFGATIRYHDTKAIYIAEFGLYSLIVGSKKKEAKDFKRRITHDVAARSIDDGLLGVASRRPQGALKATSRRPQGDLKAPSRRPQGDLTATSRRPQGDLKVTSRRPQGDLKATSR